MKKQQNPVGVPSDAPTVARPPKLSELVKSLQYCIAQHGDLTVLSAVRIHDDERLIMGGMLCEVFPGRSKGKNVPVFVIQNVVREEDYSNLFKMAAHGLNITKQAEIHIEEVVREKDPEPDVDQNAPTTSTVN